MGGIQKLGNTVESNHDSFLHYVSQHHTHFHSEDNSLAAEKVVAITNQAAQSAKHQVQSIDVSTHAVENITSGMQQITQNSQIVAASTVDASRVCSEGSLSIDIAKQQMASIQQSVFELSSIIQVLNEHSKDIGQFVQVITSIASQTNLLALNAAIEAARSGENGLGFTVVAEEIRKLSKQSAISGAQISELVATIQDKVDSILQSVNMSTKEVSEGIKIVDSAKQSFEQIETAVTTVTQQIHAVSAQVKNIALDTGELSSSGMDGVLKVANSTSADMHAVSDTSTYQLLSMIVITSSAHALTKMAEKLQQSIDKFKI
jgi:methyl-accepting chemotaxis protein